MSALKISSKLTENILENYTRELLSMKGDFDLHLPSKLDYKGFGILPHFFLLFFTWVRSNKGRVILNINESDQDAVEAFIFDYYGYTLVSTIWRSHEILTETGISLKQAFKVFTPQMHDQIDFMRTTQKESILIPNFDHYSKSRGLSHWFYNSNYNFVDAPSGLENTLFRILEKLSINRRERIKAGNRDIFNELQEIIWELSKNTDEHATTDYLGQVTLNPNSRCIYFKIQQSSKNNLLKASKDHDGLLEYYNIALREDINYLLEISVFDSGPGLVKRFLGKNWIEDQSIEADIKAIKKCLIKGQSSVVSGKGKNKGYGLDNVLDLLSRQRGFLKIRTGRSSLYRNLISHPYAEIDNFDKIDIYDWETHSCQTFTGMEWVEGTMISMVYPINEVI